MSAHELRMPVAPNGNWYHSSAPEKTKQIVTLEATGRPGMLYWLGVMNKSAAKGYAFVFDGTSSSGTLIAGPIPVDAHGLAGLESLVGIPFTTGLFVGFSTTDGTYTVSGTDDAWWHAGYHAVVGG